MLQNPDGMGIKMRSDMTNQRAALIELIEQVSNNSGLVEINATKATGRGHLVWSAYQGSVDDALSLMANLLPGASWAINSGVFEGYFAGVDSHSAAHPTNPARALLMATLKAKLATMPDEAP